MDITLMTDKVLDFLDYKEGLRLHLQAGELTKKEYYDLQDRQLARLGIGWDEVAKYLTLVKT